MSRNCRKTPFSYAFSALEKRRATRLGSTAADDIVVWLPLALCTGEARLVATTGGRRASGSRALGVTWDAGSVD